MRMMDDNGTAAVEITIGFPGAGEEPLTRAERLARRGALTPLDVERALTHILARLSSLAADETLFRHDFPAEQLDAASVRLTGEAADPSPDHRSFTVLFPGRKVTPGTVMTGVFAALGQLPLHWVTATGGNISGAVTAAELKLLRPARFESAFVNGRRVATFAAELGVRIRTSPPRGVVTRSDADRAGLR